MDDSERWPSAVYQDEALSLLSSPVATRRSTVVSHASSGVFESFASPVATRRARAASNALLLSPLSPASKPRPSHVHDTGADVQHSDLDELQPASSSLLGAVLNFTNVLLGVGVLSLPYALRLTGWAVGGSLLLGFALVTMYTARLIQRCMDRDPHTMRSFSDIALAAFGPRGRVFIAVVFFTELFVGNVAFLVLISDNLRALLPSLHLGHASTLLCATAVIWPTTLTSRLEILAYLSMLGLVSSAILVSVVLVHGAGSESPGSFVHPEPTQVFSSLQALPGALGLCMTGYAGHATCPSIYLSLPSEKRHRFPLVIAATWTIVITAYAGIAALGYLMFGDGTNAELTLNLLAAHGGPLVQVATWCIVLNPITKFCLTQNPVSLGIEELVIPHTSWPVCTSLTIRTIITAATMGTAMFVTNFGTICAFIGAAFSVTVSVTFPCFAFAQLFHGEVSGTEILTARAVGAIGLILSVVGSVAAFM